MLKEPKQFLGTLSAPTTPYTPKLELRIPFYAHFSLMVHFLTKTQFFSKNGPYSANLLSLCLIHLARISKYWLGQNLEFGPDGDYPQCPSIILKLLIFCCFRKIVLKWTAVIYYSNCLLYKHTLKKLDVDQKLTFLMSLQISYLPLWSYLNAEKHAQFISISNPLAVQGGCEPFASDCKIFKTGSRRL